MITIDQTNCIGCASCIRVCLPNLITLKNNVASFTGEQCLRCGHCAAICPTEAIKVVGFNDQVFSKDALPEKATTEELLSLIRTKRSIREFKKEKIAKEDLETILLGGKYTATASNRRTMKFVILEGNLTPLAHRAVQALLPTLPESATKSRVFTETLAGGDGLLFHAPAVILIADKISDQFEGNNAYLAASKMELIAESLGIGSCYIGYFARALLYDDQLRKDLGINDDERVYAVLALGYGDIDYLRTVERPAVDVSWLKFEA